jgi:hypothetical protein
MSTEDQINLANEAKAWARLDALLDGGKHPIQCPGCGVSTEYKKNSDGAGRRRYVCKGREGKCSKSFTWRAAESMLVDKYHIARPSVEFSVPALKSASAPRPAKGTLSQAEAPTLAAYPVTPTPHRGPMHPLILSRNTGKPLLTIPRAHVPSAPVMPMPTVVEEEEEEAVAPINPARVSQPQARPVVYVPQTQEQPVVPVLMAQSQRQGRPVHLVPQSQPNPVAVVPMPVVMPDVAPHALVPAARAPEVAMEGAAPDQAARHADDDIRATLVKIVDKMSLFQDIVMEQGRMIEDLQRARLAAPAARPARPALAAPVVQQPTSSEGEEEEEEEEQDHTSSPEYTPPASATPPIARRYAQVLEETVRKYPAAEQDLVKEALSVVRIFAPKPVRPHFKAEDTFSYRAVYITGFAWEPVKRIREALYALRFQRSRIRNICWLGHYLLEVVVDADYHHKFLDQVSAVPGLKLQADFSVTGSGAQDQEHAVDRFLARASKIAQTTKVGAVREFFTAWHDEIAGTQQGRWWCGVCVCIAMPHCPNPTCSSHPTPAATPSQPRNPRARSGPRWRMRPRPWRWVSPARRRMLSSACSPMWMRAKVGCALVPWWGTSCWMGWGRMLTHAPPTMPHPCHPLPFTASDSAEEQEDEETEDEQDTGQKAGVGMEQVDDQGRVGWDWGAAGGWAPHASPPAHHPAHPNTTPHTPTHPTPPHPPWKQKRMRSCWHMATLPRIRVCRVGKGMPSWRGSYWVGRVGCGWGWAGVGCP